jgi:hypothetical protein
MENILDGFQKIPRNASEMTKENKEVLRWLLSLPSQYQYSFGDKVDPKERWGIFDLAGRLYIKKSILNELMEENGYDTDQFMRWAKLYGLIKHGQKHTTMLKRFPNDDTPVRCACFCVRSL